MVMVVMLITTPVILERDTLAYWTWAVAAVSDVSTWSAVVRSWHVFIGVVWVTIRGEFVVVVISRHLPRVESVVCLGHVRSSPVCDCPYSGVQKNSGMSQETDDDDPYDW